MKRFFLIFFLALFIVITEIFNWTCLALDHLFFPTFKKVVVKPPLFIVGMPRSATTFCYELVVADSANMTSMKLWEILFAPSILQKKIFRFMKRIDNLMNQSIKRRILSIEKYLFQQNEAIHPISLFNYEEDDYLFLHVFSTVAYSFIFPQNKWFSSFREFDEKLTERQKRFLMNYYQGCIKRHIFVYGTHKRYLSKSPSHTPKIKTLLQYFPGSQFIYMLRDPFQTIASTVSLFKQFEKPFQLSVGNEFMLDQAMILADKWYTYVLVTFNPIHQKSIFILLFKDLVSEPFISINNIYVQFGLEIDSQFKESLLKLELDSKNFKSKNQYSPDEFGISREAIYRRYSYVYESYPLF